MDKGPDEELDLAHIKSRSVKGVVTLTGGGIILTFISGVGVLLLTTFLGPKEFGLYALIGSLIVILSYFSDIGLAASLIQKKDRLTREDLRTTFTIQQGMMVFMIAVTLLFSKFIFSYYHLSGSEIWLFYSLLAAFFMSSLKTIPSVMLERSLRFDLIMVTRIVEALMFNLTAVILAIRGMGVFSYVPAVLIQSIAGLIIIYIFNPWPVGFEYSRSSIKNLLKFGIPYQFNSLLAVAKDQFMNLFLWKIIGASGMGLVNWGFYYSQFPQRLVMDNATKVAFPALSRMQDHPGELKKSIEKLLQFITLAIFPALIFIALSWSHLVFLVPKWFKWQPALLPLFLYCFSAAMSCLSTPLTNTLYAIGKAKINTYLMLMWLALEWLLKPYFAVKYGFLGVSIAAFIISFSSLVPFVITHKITHFNILKSLRISLPASILMLGAGLIFHGQGIIWTLSASIVSYFLGLLIFGGRSLLADIRPFYNHFRAKI